MTTVFLDRVFKPFLKIVHDMDQQLTIDRTNFLTDGFLQTIQPTGFVSVNTRFQIPPKEKKISRWKIGRGRGPRHVSETGNEVTGEHVSDNGDWLVCSVRCGTILLKPHTGTSSPPGQPIEYHPFKRCQVPVGHSVQKTAKLCNWNHSALW
jgi:hypothetical protein